MHCTTPLHPAALASVPYGVVLVRVRVCTTPAGKHHNKERARPYTSSAATYLIFWRRGGKYPKDPKYTWSSSTFAKALYPKFNGLSAVIQGCNLNTTCRRAFYSRHSLNFFLETPIFDLQVRFIIPVFLSEHATNMG